MPMSALLYALTLALLLLESCPLMTLSLLQVMMMELSAFGILGHLLKKAPKHLPHCVLTTIILTGSLICSGVRI